MQFKCLTCGLIHVTGFLRVNVLRLAGKSTSSCNPPVPRVIYPLEPWPFDIVPF